MYEDDVTILPFFRQLSHSRLLVFVNQHMERLGQAQVTVQVPLARIHVK